MTRGLINVLVVVVVVVIICIDGKKLEVYTRSLKRFGTWRYIDDCVK